MSRLARPGLPAPLSDEAIERLLATLRADLDVDPLFRRRLRGRIVNRFVAAREGLQPVERPPRRMGRIGRAVLYASFALGVSVSSVMAAAQQSLPGDPLYPLKRQIEDLRVTALPASLHDDLAMHALTARISELAGLAERGDWDRVEALAAEVRDSHDLYRAVTTGFGPVTAERREMLLSALVERLPPAARAAVADVVADVERHAPAGGPDVPGSQADGGGRNSSADGPAMGEGRGAARSPREGVSSTPEPARSPRPLPTPR